MKPLRAIRTGNPRHFSRDLQAAAAAALRVRGEASLALALLRTRQQLTLELRLAIADYAEGKSKRKRGPRTSSVLQNDEWAPTLRAALRADIKARVAAGSSRDQALDAVAEIYFVTRSALEEFIYPRNPR